MKKRGFTLVELLGVIAILAIIAVIALPSVTGVIARNKEKQYNIQIDNIKELANNYVTENMMSLGESYKIYLTLYQIGIDTGNDILIKNPKTDKYFPLDTTITIDCSSGSCESTVKEGTAEYIYTDESYGSLKLSDFYVDEVGNITDYATVGSGTLTYDEKSDSIYYVLTDSNGKKVSAYLNKSMRIKNVVLKAFPFLEVGNNGCKTFNESKSYSYMGGCYLKGMQTTNYLWYSGFLWRIMGINNDGSVKLITEENVTSIPYNTSVSSFKDSHVDKWLNDYFYNNLRGKEILVYSNFCQESITTTSSSRTECAEGSIVNKKIGLISLDEYNLANGISSYLLSSQFYWTMSPYSDSDIWYVHSSGGVYSDNVTYAKGVKIVINVNPSSIVTSGNGTMSQLWTKELSPYILNEKKESSITGDLKDKVKPGEYVKLANKIYRAVSIDNNGNVKLILDGYYQETPNTKYTIAYGTTTFTTASGVGAKLNGDVLNWLIPIGDVDNRNKLVSNYTWYQNVLQFGNSYTISLNELTPLRSVQATVGLIRVGEMLSGQSYTILTKNGTVANDFGNSLDYWTMNTNLNDSSNWCVQRYGSASENNLNNNALRPVIVVKSDTKITSGNGTPSNPFEI